MLHMIEKYFTRLFKGAAVFLLTVSLSIGFILLSAQPSSAAQFSDTGGHWAESYIDKAASLGIITGYTDGTFRPNASVTRAEFAGMVNRTLGNRGTTYITFPDVYSTDWYYADVTKAVAATYVAGYADGYFKPKNPISRQEAAVMLARIVPTGGFESNLRSYPDSSGVASWSSDVMARICGKGYLGPYKNDNRLHPTDPLTRAQTAKILCEIKEKESIMTSDPQVKSNGTTLSNRIYVNNVTIDKGLSGGSATLENCTVLGSFNVEGGGASTVTLSNTRIADCSVNRSSSQVRLMAKGATTIANLTASNDSILQTSGLSGGEIGKGFSQVTLRGSSDVTLRGGFPNVTVDGNNAELLLDSGSISQLTVSSSGRGSDITVRSGTTVTNADVNAAASFYGNGTISTMRVNSNGVTYETKPKNLSVASGVKSPNQEDDDDDYTDGARFYPSYRTNNVGINTDITITFDTPMTLYNGKSITSSNIDDFVTLRRGSSGGSSVNFSASISSNKRVITIDPDSSLSKDTRYYVTVDKNALKDEDGDGNAYLSSYFDTGESSSSDGLFSPENGDVNVPLNEDIVINLPAEVIRYSNGDTISNRDSYLSECVEFRMDGSGGEEVPSSFSINSSKDRITIDPDDYLEANRTYYVAIVKNRMKSEDDGTVIPAANAAWQTAGLPIISDLKITGKGETYVDISAGSNVAGTLYTVAIPSDGSAASGAPSSAQVVSGTNASGMVVPKNSTSVRAGYASTMRVSGLMTETGYTVYGAVKDPAGNISTAISAFETTAAGYLSELSINAVTRSGNSSQLKGFAFSPTTPSYGFGGSRLTVPKDAAELEITAKGTATAVITAKYTVNGKEEISTPFTNGTARISPLPTPTAADPSGLMELEIVYQTAEGKTPTSYTIGFYRESSAEITGIRIRTNNSSTYSDYPATLAVTSVPTTSPTVRTIIDGAESGALIAWKIDGVLIKSLTASGDAPYFKFDLFGDEDNVTSKTYRVEVVVTSKDGSAENVYPFDFIYTPPVQDTTQP